MSYEGLHPTFAQMLLQTANGQAVAPPSDGWAIRLYKDLFTDAGVATQLVAASSAGYLPAETGANSTSWSTPSGRVSSNASPILWPLNSSADTPWETATSVAIGKKTASASPLPEVCFFGKLDSSYSNPVGDRLRYPIGGLKVRFFSDQTAVTALFAHKILGLLSGAGITPPNTFYVGLGKETPDINTGEFGEIPELARVPITATAGKWVAGMTPRELQNAQILEFIEASADLPKIKSFGVFDEPRAAGAAPSLSGQWWFGKTTSDKVIYRQDIIVVLASGLTMGL